ncbi:MAG: eL32 family ribosomal protein [Candidatus Micrarchaeota archaeon]
MAGKKEQKKIDGPAKEPKLPVHPANAASKAHGTAAVSHSKAEEKAEQPKTIDSKPSAQKEAGQAGQKPKKEKKAKPLKPKSRRTGTAVTGKAKKTLIKVQDQIKNKARHNFRRRIGNRWTHNITGKKWDKWRKARGIDIQRKQEYGLIPDSGYRTPANIRGLHPSGLKELMVHNAKQAQLASNDVVVRIARTVGKKKRKEILTVCQAKKVRVVN